MASQLVTDILLRPLAIEEDFDPDPWHTWMQREGLIIYAVSTIVYLVAIFTIRRLMRNRPRFVLKTPLFLWNVGLGVFSTVCAWRLNVATNHVLAQRGAGLHALVCEARSFAPGNPAPLWLFLFVMSKLVEYGDTMFVVLRKANLIVLHWYHHVITYLITAYLFAYRVPTVFAMSMINAYVHAIMYPYYALRILGVVVPRRVAMMITSVQIAQLFTGFLINVYAAWALLNGVSCDVDDVAVGMGLLGFGSVLVLFVNFFVHSYIWKTPRKRAE